MGGDGFEVGGAGNGGSIAPGAGGELGCEDAEPTDATPAGEVDPENLPGDVDPDTGDQPTA